MACQFSAEPFWTADLSSVLSILFVLAKRRHEPMTHTISFSSNSTHQRILAFDQHTLCSYHQITNESSIPNDPTIRGWTPLLLPQRSLRCCFFFFFSSCFFFPPFHFLSYLQLNVEVYLLGMLEQRHRERCFFVVFLYRLPDMLYVLYVCTYAHASKCEREEEQQSGAMM